MNIQASAASVINVDSARKTCYIAPYGQPIVRQILSGDRSHRDLKIAFDWDATPEGHAYWSKVRKADELSTEARRKLIGYLYFAEQANPSPDAIKRTTIG